MGKQYPSNLVDHLYQALQCYIDIVVGHMFIFSKLFTTFKINIVDLIVWEMGAQ